MKRLWKYEGVEVVLTGVVQYGDPGFEGYAVRERGGSKNVYEWTAYPTPNGYTICVRSATGKMERCSTSATYDLGLEVATVARRM